MILDSIIIGPIGTNCYFAGCKTTGKIVIIDPGDEPDRITAHIKKNGWIPDAIILTHAHIDHVGAVKRLQDNLKLKTCMHAADMPLLDILPIQSAQFGLTCSGVPDIQSYLKDGDIIQVGMRVIRTLHTPGHSPGGISLLFEDSLFTGDALFRGSVGRSDLPGGDADQLIESIHRKILILPDTTTIYPGHGPSSTIGREKRSNPFLR